MCINLTPHTHLNGIHMPPNGRLFRLLMHPWHVWFCLTRLLMHIWLLFMNSMASFKERVCMNLYASYSLVFICHHLTFSGFWYTPDWYACVSPCLVYTFDWCLTVNEPPWYYHIYTPDKCVLVNTPHHAWYLYATIWQVFICFFRFLVHPWLVC